MNLKDKKVGIWGLGIVGKAAINFFAKITRAIEVIDAKQPADHDLMWLKKQNIHFFLQEEQLEAFLERNDVILASPGIDLRPYSRYAHKWITELDIFDQEFKQPIIAITGSVGKTTVTTLLSQLLNGQECSLYTGGNIGMGMLDILHTQENIKGAVLEVSSFQLEQCKYFGPDLAIWTTFYPNHLDRHGTLEEYFQAKKKILAYQTSTQHALLPYTLLEFLQNRSSLQGKRHFFSTSLISQSDLQQLLPHETIFYLDGRHIMHYANNQHTIIMDTASLPPITFQENWLIICSALHLIHTYTAIKNNLNAITHLSQNLLMPEHRLELVTTKNGIAVYNDSKSTTTSSTLAAVNQLKTKPVHLIIGGLSKGVDRSEFVQSLKNKVVHVYCFGKEADALKSMADKATIPADSFSDLDSAFAHCYAQAKTGEIVVFSPAGSSFDLFKNYQERGIYFKGLVRKITTVD